MLPRTPFARAFFPRRPARRAFRPGPACEVLEDRLVLTGNVEAFVSDGNLFVLGDDAGNEIEIGFGETVRLEPVLTLTGVAGTTLNGGGSSLEFPRNPDFLVVLMGGGDDRVTIGGDRDAGSPALAARSGVYVGLGAGDDFLLALGLDVSGGYVAALGGDGDDQIRIGQATDPSGDAVARGGAAVDLFAFGENGDDYTEVTGTNLSGAFVLVAGEGRDTVVTVRNRVAGTAYLYGGGGVDRFLSLRDRFSMADEGFLVFSGGPGGDVDNRGGFLATDLTVNGTTLIYLGDGADNLQLEQGRFDGRTFVYAGAGDDQLSLVDSQFAGPVLVDGEDGEDVLQELGEVSDGVRSRNVYLSGLTVFGVETRDALS